MACTLAESPRDPFHRELRQLRCLHCRLDCYRVERTSSRAGVTPTEVQRLFTAHCYANYEQPSDTTVKQRIQFGDGEQRGQLLKSQRGSQAPDTRRTAA